MTDTEPQTAAPAPGFLGASDRVELVATIALAIATILTAWSAFQAGKWSGTQAINFSEAGASRTESTRAGTKAGQQTQIDAAMFIDWVTAISNELDAGKIVIDEATGYTPTEGTVSGFLYLRFRDEFKPAVDAWLAADPINNADAPTSPFEMLDDDGDPIYVTELSLEADRLADVADQKAADAREANQNGDNYVLTMVLFASVLFFAGVSSKLIARRNRIVALSIGVVILISGMVILASLPIKF